MTNNQYITKIELTKNLSVTDSYNPPEPTPLRRFSGAAIHERPVPSVVFWR